MKGKIEISQKTLITALGLIFAVWLLTRISQIILILFVSFIIMSALKPVVHLIEKSKLHRAWAIVIVYILIWLLIGGIIAAIIPPLVVQTRHLILTIPYSLDNLQFLNIHQDQITNEIISLVGTLPQNVLKIAAGIFGNIINLFTTLVISFYLLTERKNLDGYLSRFLGEIQGVKISEIVTEVEFRLGAWVRGELFLMLFIGICSYIGLRILGIESALPLAILAGLLEIVPNIGPILSAVPAVITAMTINPIITVSTVALYFLIQNLENSFIVPFVMNKATGVNPLISLLGLMVGFELAGPIGTVLAIPAILTIETVCTKYFCLPTSQVPAPQKVLK